VVFNSLLIPSLNSVYLAAGTKGQIVIIEVNALVTGAGVRFTSNPTNNMILSCGTNNNIDLTGKSTITLLYDGSIWIELSHSVNR
jgi:hypothetical protein